MEWLVSNSNSLSQTNHGEKIYVSTIPIMRTNSWNLVVPSGFVSPFASISCVGTYLKMIDQSFTSSRDLWYLIGICFVFQWYSGLLVSLITPWLSAKMRVRGETVFRYPSSSIVSRITYSANRPQIQTALHAASVWAMYSASQVDVETVGCLRLAHEIGPPLKMKK